MSQMGESSFCNISSMSHQCFQCLF
uniref:Uncharacterized protein n=1 Tax=Anguilla anguilla TaxID=7936 RepID=A0A0E9STU4_ANGAN